MEDERMEMLREFFALYRKLQKDRTLRMQSHFDNYGQNYIEIWECKDHKRLKSICRAKEETEEACYKRAIGDLKRFIT